MCFQNFAFDERTGSYSMRTSCTCLHIDCCYSVVFHKNTSINSSWSRTLHYLKHLHQLPEFTSKFIFSLSKPCTTSPSSISSHALRSWSSICPTESSVHLRTTESFGNYAHQISRTRIPFPFLNQTLNFV